MTPHPDNLIQIGKGIAALGAAGTLYALETLTHFAQAVPPGVPDILREFGYPTLMSGVLLYGIVKLHQSFRACEEARVKDNKENAERWQTVYVETTEAAQASREKLIEVTTTQNILTQEMTQKLEEILEKKP